MITCEEAVRQLWDFVDQALGPEEQEAVGVHLAFCRRCCGELEFARELRRLLASRAATELPPDVRSRMERLLDEMGDPV